MPFMITAESDILSADQRTDQGGGSIGVRICLYKWYHNNYSFSCFGIDTSSLLVV